VKEIMVLHARKTYRERSLREDRVVVDGDWRHAGVEETPCE
jgi:hypothetical protein